MITALSPTTGSSASSSTSSSNKSNNILGKDDFMKLLVAQMQAQDPLDPMSNTEFSAQLAQFSALEQMQNVNTNLESLIEFQAVNNNNMAINLIDKKITVPGNNLTISNGVSGSGTVTLFYELGRNAATVTVNIYDSLNNLVASIDQQAKTAGRNEFAWDGKNSNGTTLPDGDYTFEVSAVDDAESTVVTRTLYETLVTGILFENGIGYVATEDGDVIELKNITSVNSSS